MRKLIAEMKISTDGKMEGLEGVADWVEAWSEDCDLIERIDACVLGGGMYPGYERYWSAVQSAPESPIWITGKVPTVAEVIWARFAERTPHYVLSETMTSARWPKTRFLRTLSNISELKRQPGGDIYLIGGAQTTASAIEAGLVDELRLIVYPLIVGEGRALSEPSERSRGLSLRDVQALPQGRVSLVYGIA